MDTKRKNSIKRKVLLKYLYLKKLFVVLCCFYLSNVYAGSYVLILTKGKGGDFHGGEVLTRRIEHADIPVKLYNLSDHPLENANFKDSVDIILMGQGVLNDVMQQSDLNYFANKRIFIYSHLYSKESVNFIGKIAKLTHTQVTIYITESQLYKLNTKLPININIVDSPLVINSYDPDRATRELYYQDSKIIDQIIANQAIHLGGSYSDSENNLVYINNGDIETALMNLPLRKKYLTSVILHPRTFLDCKNASGEIIIDKVVDRINLIRASVSTKTLDKVNVFLPKVIKEKLDGIRAKYDIGLVFTSPNYNSIIYAINTPDRKMDIGMQFISADQYNAFANISIPVYPFLLKPNDTEQKAYILSYQNMLACKNSKLGGTYILDSITNKILLSQTLQTKGNNNN